MDFISRIVRQLLDSEGITNPDDDLLRNLEDIVRRHTSGLSEEEIEELLKGLQGGNSTDTPSAEEAEERRAQSHDDEDERREQEKKDREERKKEIDARVKAYKKTPGQWVAELVPFILGRAAGTFGSAWNARNSILANALMSMAENSMPEETARIYGNPLKRGAAFVTGPYMAQGQVANVIGQGLEGIGENISNAIEAENQRVRNYRDNLENHPSGLYFDSQRKYRQHDPSDSHMGSSNIGTR